jgi:hypothetical protein
LSSGSLCQPTPDCVKLVKPYFPQHTSIKLIIPKKLIFRLSAKVIKIHFPESLEALINKAEKQHVEMAAKFCIFNNGNGTLEQSIERSKTYSEELAIEQSSTLSHQHQLSIDVSVSTSFRTSIPFIAEGVMNAYLSIGHGLEAHQPHPLDTNRFLGQRERLRSIKGSPFTSSGLTSTPLKIWQFNSRHLWSSPLR